MWSNTTHSTVIGIYVIQLDGEIVSCRSRFVRSASETSGLRGWAAFATTVYCFDAALEQSYRRRSDSSSSRVRGQSEPSSRERLRSAKTRPPVWHCAQ